MNLKKIPPQFQELGLTGISTPDGFWLAEVPLSELLLARDIRTFPNDRGESRECGLFFDDWHLYAVPEGESWVYSLVKLREQEYDAACGRIADGDTPGVTVSFIEFCVEIFRQCLAEPTVSNRAAMNREINRVVSVRGQAHHPALKHYFERTEAQGAYLIAWVYIHKIAALAENGRVPLPEVLRAKPEPRIFDFLNRLNSRAGRTVADEAGIYLHRGKAITDCEALAILAAYTADLSLPAFAAEVQYHARFLTPLAKVPIPMLGRSAYDSAIRADMTVDDGEAEGPAPYHRQSSLWVRRQAQAHPQAANLCCFPRENGEQEGK